VVVSVSTDGSALDRTMAVGVRRYLQQSPIVVLVGLLGVLVAGLAIARPGTVTPGWISSVVLFAAPLGIMAAGQTLVMITGGIDLSVANVATAAAYVMASQASHGTLTAVALALLIGLVVGLVNGAGVAVFKVQPLIMTLGMGLVVTGTLTVYSQLAVKSVPGVPPFIHELGARTVLGVVPVSLFLWAPLAAAVILGLHYSGYGRLLYAVGDNATACRLSGVRVWQVLLVVYALSGLLAAVGGLVLAGSTNAADLSLATIYLLPVVAAVVIGGTSIYGGSGSYSGTIVGALILTVLNSLLTLLDAPDPLKQILYGAIILALAAAYTRVLSEA
jgi:ribose transport system permease protein